MNFIMQKHTDIEPVPVSWKVVTIESVCIVKSSAMSYKQLDDALNIPNGVRVLGVKVADMNLPGNETEFISANLERHLSESEAEKRSVPENSTVFPKRGAAIATNKKRLTTCRTVLDPNLIAVTPNAEVNYKYLFYWFNAFDLKQITDPGPTPQLNKKDIAPLQIPLPPLDEQEKISTILSMVQRAIETQERIIQTTTKLKKALMQKLFTEGLRNEPQKETEIGTVPESWEVSHMSVIADLKSGGTPSRKKHEYWDNGSIPWVKTGVLAAA